MTKPKYRSVVVKVGTNVITQDDGLLDTATMQSITQQIAALMHQGIQVIMVSSGAMGAGRAQLKDPSKKLSRVQERQMLAAIGQVHLIQTYAEFFRAEDITVAQVLATREDFRERHHYLNMRTCFEALAMQGVMPIVNENDVVSIEELMFTDNDELAGLIATMVDADALILLTNVDGLYDGDPSDSSAQVIARIEPNDKHWQSCVRPGQSQFGRGGMRTKSQTACKLSQMGITTHICNGTHPGVLGDIFAGADVGTTFAAGAKKVSGVKRWVGGGVGQTNGVVTINACAREVITSTEKIASLLPVGVTGVEGDFAKGDLVRIRDEDGNDLGLGIASYGAEQAKKVMGQQGQKALIHYDHLYIS